MVPNIPMHVSALTMLKIAYSSDKFCEQAMVDNLHFQCTEIEG